MTTPNARPPLTAEKAAQLKLLVRLMGAVLILGGMVLGLDVGGLATQFGLNDGTDASTHQLIGGLLVLMGLFDFFVMPRFFKPLDDKNNQAL